MSVDVFLVSDISVVSLFYNQLFVVRKFNSKMRYIRILLFNDYEFKANFDNSNIKIGLTAYEILYIVCNYSLDYMYFHFSIS